MPRIARKNVKVSFIHVMVQGVNKEFIFNEKKFLNYYLKSIKSEIRYKEFDLLAYCMMNNHAHFLFYVRDMDCFGKFMKSVNQSFANFYNKSIDRVGTVFRNRYQLEQIKDYEHLINCIKYIHNNPVKAGMVTQSKDYLYSSYHDYYYGRGCAKYDILKEVFGENTNYLRVIESANDRRFIDLDNNFISNEYFENGIKSFMKEYNCSWLDILSERNTLIKLLVYLKQEFKINYRKTIELLDISRGIINIIK